jgi:hypothetical protein
MSDLGLKWLQCADCDADQEIILNAEGRPATCQKPLCRQRPGMRAAAREVIAQAMKSPVRSGLVEGSAGRRLVAERSENGKGITTRFGKELCLFEDLLGDYH